jgi:hypothetical protein
MKLCDGCDNRSNWLIVAWGRELNSEEKRYNRKVKCDHQAEKCDYYERYFNKSFKPRQKNCEGFVSNGFFGENDDDVLEKEATES